MSKEFTTSGEFSHDIAHQQELTTLFLQLGNLGNRAKKLCDRGTDCCSITFTKNQNVWMPEIGNIGNVDDNTAFYATFHSYKSAGCMHLRQRLDLPAFQRKVPSYSSRQLVETSLFAGINPLSASLEARFVPDDYDIYEQIHNQDYDPLVNYWGERSTIVRFGYSDRISSLYNPFHTSFEMLKGILDLSEIIIDAVEFKQKKLVPDDTAISSLSQKHLQLPFVMGLKKLLLNKNP